MACDNFLTFLGAAKGGNLPPASKQPIGESLDINHQGSTELKSFEFGAENPTTLGSSTGGAGAGKVKFQNFKVTKEVDYASGPLYLACAAGAHFPGIALQIRKAGGSQNDYLVYLFKMVYVVSISWCGGGGEEAPEETVEFTYGSMGLQYIPQASDGTQSPLHSVGFWSQVTNAPSMEVPGIAAGDLTAPAGGPFAPAGQKSNVILSIGKLNV
jgi:type VI secretion system secreted protein Hcp